MESEDVTNLIMTLSEFIQDCFRAHHVRITLARLNSPLLALREIQMIHPFAQHDPWIMQVQG